MKNGHCPRNLARRGTMKRSVLVVGVVVSAFVASTASAQAPPEPIVSTPGGSAAPVAPLPAGSVDLSSAPDAPPVVVKENHFLNRPLFVTGLILFGGTYASSLVVGAESSRAQDHHDLFYPVVGPWVDVGHRDCAANHCTNETGALTLLSLDGIAQGVGVVAIILSLVVPERTSRKYFLGSDRLSVSPMRLGMSAYGMGAHGSF